MLRTNKVDSFKPKSPSRVTPSPPRGERVYSKITIYSFLLIFNVFVKVPTYLYYMSEHVRRILTTDNTCS